MPAVDNAQPLRVFVCVLLQKTFVEKVGGDQVVVEPLVLPGHNPATYNLTPKQISALANSVLYIRTSVPFENAWMGRIRSANPNMRLLDARLGIDLRKVQPQFNKKAAEQVASALGGRVVAIDPLSADYAATLPNFAQQIAEAQN